MLWLKRNIHFNDFIKDDTDGSIIKYGDYYFEDSETKKKIKCSTYWDMKKDQLEKENPYTGMMKQAQNETEYRAKMQQREQNYLKQKIFLEDIAYKKIR